jgi:thiol-disulfide isomerase/thioredoxin
MTEDAQPPQPPEGTSRHDAARRKPSNLRRLDRRAIGLCLCVALVVALAAGLIMSFLGTGKAGPADAGPDRLSLTRRTATDTTKAFRTRLFTFEGRATTLATRVGHGRPTVVNFFSSTCAPCIREMPALERVHRRRRDVSFVGIDVQDDVSTGRRFVKRTGITYEALRDPPADLLRAVDGIGLPTTMVLDGSGRVVATHTGALTEATLGQLLDSKLR